MPKIVAMIPARLGSKRVKNKNLRILGKKPLIAHVIETAKAADVFDGIYINSEADIFSGIALQYGVEFYKRPLALASDQATNDMFLLDFVDHILCDIVIQINPTSPLLSVDDVRRFVAMMTEGDYDTLHSVKSEQIEGLFDGEPLNFDPRREMPRSQDLKPVVLFSSGIMGWKVSNYRKNIANYGAATYGGDGNIGYFTLSGFSVIDIDQEEDFRMAELAIAYQDDTTVHEPSYYQPQGVSLRAEEIVLDILKKDGVFDNDLDDVNHVIVNIEQIIKSQDNTKSWSKRIINTENNSATLISQMPGEGNRLHYHHNWNEWWYILEGEWEFEIEGKRTMVKKGDIVFIEKGQWHKITCVGDRPAVRLAVSKDKVPHIYREDLPAQSKA